MDVRKFSRLVALLFSLLAVGLLSAPVFGDGTTVGIPGGCRGGSVSVPAGSPLTLASGWTMSTRGNTQAFANAATGILTVNGQTVTPIKSDVFQASADIHPDGNADDAWRVRWLFATTAPSLGESMVVTFNIELDHPVADHEFGPGQPVILPEGPLFANPFTCTVTGI